MKIINFPILILVTISLVGGAFGSGLLGLMKGSNLLSLNRSNIMISMKEGSSGQLVALNEENNGTRAERATKVTSLLQTFAAASQGPVLSILKTLGVKPESFWISNQIYVKNANPTIVQSLMANPAVGKIAEEKVYGLYPLDEAVGPTPNGTEWNVELVGAPKVWEDGTTGAGILVGGIDTGVRLTHDTLKDSYVGTHGWYDPYLHTKTPSDLHGHGTHTMGTSVGKNGIGVAPGAQWMACRGCINAGCQQHTLLACGQFMLCPSAPTKGKNENECEGVPDVVNNSWGTSGGQRFYDEVIKAWLTAGIKPFFAQGNSGPKCVTGGSPADSLDVISVGSTDKEDKISKFSSRGPTLKNKAKDDRRKKRELVPTASKTDAEVATDVFKPEICAPGEKVNSADMLSDTAYKVQSGTSMATPATVGVAALLLSKNPKLTWAELKELLLTTTEQKLDLTPNGAEACGPEPPEKYPNHMCGHGRVNATAAYRKLKQDMGLPLDDPKKKKKPGNKKKTGGKKKKNDAGKKKKTDDEGKEKNDDEGKKKEKAEDK